MNRVYAWVRRSIILLHRWLGIPLSFLFLMWFVSGIAMIWARGMPALTPELRLERMLPLDLSRVRIGPADAAARAGSPRGNGRLTLLTVMGRPAYRVAGPGGGMTIFADTGALLGEVGDNESLQIAARFANAPASSVHQLAVLDDPASADQWSIGQRRLMPLRKFAVDDGAGTQLYVSEDTAEVVLLTTRASRTLAWVAAIPHWMYFRALRVKDRWWTQAVLWTSGIGMVLTVLGLVLALTQMRTKYVGWMRWHYVTGAIFGVLTLTWVFSGWLSMDPIDWEGGGPPTVRVPPGLNAGPAPLDRFPSFDPVRWEDALGRRIVKEIELRSVQGAPYYVVRGVEPKPLLMAAETMQIRREPFSTSGIVDLVARGNRNVTIASSELITSYDAYYYDRDREAPLPVVRIKFADSAQTWLYVDPMMSQAVARFTRGRRVERWLYHGLHSLDFSFWYYNTPLWETGMVVLLGGGSILSFVGMVIGLKRLRRTIKV